MNQSSEHNCFLAHSGKVEKVAPRRCSDKQKGQAMRRRNDRASFRKGGGGYRDLTGRRRGNGVSGPNRWESRPWEDLRTAERLMAEKVECQKLKVWRMRRRRRTDLEVASVRESDTQIMKGLMDEGQRCSEVEEGKSRWRR